MLLSQALSEKIKAEVMARTDTRACANKQSEVSASAVLLTQQVQVELDIARAADFRSSLAQLLQLMQLNQRTKTELLQVVYTASDSSPGTELQVCTKHCVHPQQREQCSVQSCCLLTLSS